MGKLVPPWHSHQPLRWDLLNLIQRGNSSQPEARSLHRQCQNFPLVPFATAKSSDSMELALSQHG
ncbi:unnamed protein product, partial [Clonostachys chloroleuca]